MTTIQVFAITGLMALLMGCGPSAAPEQKQTAESHRATNAPREPVLAPELQQLKKRLSTRTMTVSPPVSLPSFAWKFRWGIRGFGEVNSSGDLTGVFTELQREFAALTEDSQRFNLRLPSHRQMFAQLVAERVAMTPEQTIVVQIGASSFQFGGVIKVGQDGKVSLVSPIPPDTTVSMSTETSTTR